MVQADATTVVTSEGNRSSEERAGEQALKPSAGTAALTGRLMTVSSHDAATMTMLPSAAVIHRGKVSAGQTASRKCRCQRRRLDVRHGVTVAHRPSR